MVRIHFKDDGQDILWWDVDEKGIVKQCNMQGQVWIGTEVIGTPVGSVKPQDIKPGEKLICLFPSGGGGEFIHPVIKVESLDKSKTRR